MKLYSMEEMLDQHIGKVGTPERDDFDAAVENELSKLEQLRQN